jgi:hypothetical protein
VVRRKHRLYIDVTFSKAVTTRSAGKGLQLVLDTRLDLARAPVWAYDSSPYIDKLVVVEVTGRRRSAL